MTELSAPADFAQTLSVSDLVRQRAGDAGDDPWNLALVQRAVVWDEVRMRHLLDSLLSGYPIGSLLLCRTTAPTKTIDQTKSGRAIVAGSANAPQLVDGQQRVNALFSLFTDRSGFGRFYLDMTTDREAPVPITARGAKERALRYIKWQPADETAASHSGATDPILDAFDRREHHLDLSRWYAWTREHELPAEVNDSNVVALLREIDDEFTDQLGEKAKSNASDRLRRLLRAWQRPSVPVIVADVEDPADILEVFTRINLAGVPVNRNDVYFAAVKMFWPDAEAALERLVEHSRGLLDPLTALSLLSRLAVRGLGMNDMVPLAVERLSGDQREPVRDAIGTVLGNVEEPIKRFGTYITQHSRLGLGLRFTHRLVWEEIFAWAVTSQHPNNELWRESSGAIDSYVLGTSIFSYHSILGDGFRRAAFLEALVAGCQNAPFPTQQIIGVARDQHEQLRVGQRQVSGAGTTQDKILIAESHRRLLLSVAHELPFDTSQFDWDHILASAKRRHMRTAGGNGRQVFIPGSSSLINSTGNLWLLDLGANRALGETYPGPKFQQLRAWRTDGGYRVWNDQNWAMPAEDEAAFTRVGELLKSGDVTAAVDLFRTVVNCRAHFLTASALERFHGVADFASDSIVEPMAASQLTELDTLSERLGVEEVRTAMETRLEEQRLTALTKEHASEEERLGLPHPWTGRGGELVWAMKKATRAHTLLTFPDSSARRAWSRDRFIARAVPLTAPEVDAHIDIAVDGSRAASERTPFWLRVPRTASGATTIVARLRAADLPVERSEDAYWTPIEVPYEPRWDGLATVLIERIDALRRVIEDPTGPIAL